VRRVVAADHGMLYAVSSNGPAVSIRSLVVERGGTVVLRAIDVDVPRGQVVGLLGPSGCGKTTFDAGDGRRPARALRPRVRARASSR
jgi:ABC-type transport system involved in cytochrome bd biosynthesis fused ATPase/permease subunit